MIKLLEKIPVTAFVSILLRVSFMVLSLIAIKVSYHVYTSREFIEFNYVLFLVGISNFIYYPFTIDLWQNPHKNNSIGISLAFFLCLFFMAGAVALFFVKDFYLDIWIFIGTVLYGLARYSVRISYVARLSDQQYFTAYISIFLCLALEYVGLLFIYIADWPVAARLLLPGFILIYVVRTFFQKGFIFYVRNAFSSIKQYLDRKNLFLIVYMGFFSVLIVCDRAIAYSEQDDLAAILLVFSFTTSILTLFNVILDTSRPKIIYKFNHKKSLSGLWKEIIIILVQVYLVSLTLGYFIAVKLSIIPGQMFAYWGSFLTVNLLISLNNLFQITRQTQKEMTSVNISWGAALLVKIGLYAIFKTMGLSYLSFTQSLVGVFFITLGINYYYECRFLLEKYGRVKTSA